MPNTINSISPQDCTGCGACVNACPRSTIQMKYDHEGFIFPEIIKGNCIYCGKCLSVCPVNHPLKFHPTPETFAVWAADDIRLKSSSGGMFTLMANHILDAGGVVCGARYSDDFTYVYHEFIGSKLNLGPLRGAKYV